MAQSSNWEADKMLDVYIHDYLVKRNLLGSAKAFQAEAKVSTDPVAIDAPGGFLFEWWSVFWDIFIARTNDKHSEVAASYIETQQIKAREQQQQQQHQQQQHHQQQQVQHQQHQQHQQQQQLQQQQHQQQQHQQQQVHIHQLQLMQRQAQQHQKQHPRIDLAPANGLAVDMPANAIATKIYEDNLKHPQSMEDVKRYNVDQLMENQLKGTPTGGAGQPSGSMLPNVAAAAKLQSRPPLSGLPQDNNNTVLNQRSPAPDPSMFSHVMKPSLSSPGVNPSGPNSIIPLKGWSMGGMDQMRLQNQKPTMQQPQAFQQMHILNPQQQLMMQAQAQGSLPPSNSALVDVDGSKLRTLFNRGKDGQAALSDNNVLARSQEMMMKLKMAQQSHPTQNPQQPQQQQPSQPGQPQPATPQAQQQQQQQQQQQDRMAVDPSLSNSFRGSEQVYNSMEPSPSTNSTGTGKGAAKGAAGRKRKQPASSSGPANSTGTGNTAGPSPNSPSSPSTHTAGDVMSIAGTLNQSGSISKSLMMYGSDGSGMLASPSNQLADMERFVEDPSLDENVESFLSHDDTDHRDSLFAGSKQSPAMDVSKGFQFKEVECLRASTSKVVCCHFSSDGKLLATAGHDKKAVLWNMDTKKMMSTLEEHTFLITDVRFSPSSTRLATSSFDKSVRVWDSDNPSFSLRNFTGHQTSVMSLDFHPVNEDLLCSCDADSEIRYWSVNQGVCTRIFKGGMTQTRFQPRVGRLLAAAAENIVSIFDVETETCVHSLQRHTKPVHSVCWDSTGDYVASVSEDSVRVWSLGSGSDGDCIHELNCNGNKFHSCVFHPKFPSLLVIGCYQSLELWNMRENKSMTIPAHDGLIAALAQCPATGMVASASHDKFVKLWK